MRMGTTELFHKDGIFGDKDQTISLCPLYDKQLLVMQRKKCMVKYKKEPLSDKKIRQHLELPSHDRDFKSFNEYVIVRY